MVGDLPAVIFTIGHSTRGLEEFVAVLRGHGVEQVLDVRSLPGSRRYPHFDREALAVSLPAAGLAYQHLPALGGRRRARSDSPNTGWTHASFRGYADYMQTAAFAAGLDEAEALARAHASALMCAEAVPWRCHRSLLGDAFACHGWTVLDILGPGAAKPHRLTPFLRVGPQGELLYPGG